MTPEAFAALRSRRYQGGSVDRSSVDDARRVLRQLLPEEEAQAVALAVLATYIRLAHQHTPGCWSLSLYPGCIRLNIGRLLALEVVYGAVWAFTLKTARSYNTLAPFLLGERAFAVLTVEHDQLAIPAAELQAAQPHLVADAPEVVAIAASTSTVCPYRKGWSAGIWQLIREQDEQLPEPVWRAKVEAKQAQRGAARKVGQAVPASTWSADLWQWIEQSTERAGTEPTFRLYGAREPDAVYLNGRIANATLRVDADDHLLDLVSAVPEAFKERLDGRYKKTWSSGAARIRRAAGTTVPPATAAHTAIIPHQSPHRTTISLNVYRYLFIRADELAEKLAEEQRVQLEELVAKQRLDVAFSQQDLAFALGLVDEVEARAEVDDTEDPEDEELEEEEPSDDIIWEDHRNVIFFGPPGTGKSHELDALVRDHLKATSKHVYRITFHPETSYFDFVGTYKPVVGWLKSLNEFTAADRSTSQREPRVYYDFDPGPFSLALADALAHPEERVVLIIEEINRGNTAAIFGDVFQLLDRVHADDAQVPFGTSQYPIHPGSDWARWLDDRVGERPPCWEEGRLRLPSNLYLYATMNTSDQSLFPMDTAFRRRWGLRYKGVAAPATLTTRVRRHADDTNGLLWSHLMRVLNRAIVEHTRTDDKQVGPWYLRPRAGEDLVPQVEFRSKVLFYLWSDVFRDAPAKVFRDDITTYDELLQRYDAGEDVFRDELLTQVPGA